MVSWQSPLCPFRIDFEPGKLEEIRRAVIEGFYVVPRGGVEVGGVLYGKRFEDRLEIYDYRGIETEYLYGPSFQLSERDKSQLRELLQGSKLPDAVEVVGWYHSRTRGNIQLPEKHRALYDEFFPKVSQVTLILKPDKTGVVKGDYFFREADGSVEANLRTEEFVLPVSAGVVKERLVPLPVPEAVVVEQIEPRPKSFWKNKYGLTVMGVGLAVACLICWLTMR